MPCARQAERPALRLSMIEVKPAATQPVKAAFNPQESPPVLPRRDLPLVYSCSGCSNLAQLANHVAVTLDRRGEAEMSCIAGLGGDVPALVRVATSGRPIVAIDGCPLVCVKSTLARHGLQPVAHHVLTDWGLKKRQHEEASEAERVDAVERIAASLGEVRQG